MNEKTSEYLRGTFEDYYENAALPIPDNADERKWTLEFWNETTTDNLTFNEIDRLGEFLAYENPRDVFVSTALYEEPGEEETEPTGSYLLFEIALPDMAPYEEDATFGDKLEKCKRAAEHICLRLDDDLGFDDIELFFDGNNKFQIIVKDESIRGLSSEQRRQIAEYLKGEEFDLENFPENTTSSGEIAVGTRQLVQLQGGWYADFYSSFIEFMEKVQKADQDLAKDQLMQYPRIGDKTADSILETLNNSGISRLRAGNLNFDSDIMKLARRYADEYFEEKKIDFDETVTEQVESKVRVPGSLNGQTGLIASEIDLDAVDEFNPTWDTIPDALKDGTIAVDVLEERTVSLYGEQYDVTEGRKEVPEFVGVYLMCRGFAEKA